jgi:hypothetical protein
VERESEGPVAESLEEPALHPAAEDRPDAEPEVVAAAAPDIAEAAAFVYALGQIEPRFPTLGLEKEVAQAMGRAGDDDVSNRQAFLRTIADDQHRYLARNMCWLFLVEGLETYVIVPRDPLDYRLMIESVREHPRRDDVDVIVGTRGPIAPPHLCNGLAVPVVYVDQVYSFDRETLVREIPVPDAVPAKDRKRFQDTAGSFFDRVMRMTDNAGATDEHRALNYLAVRYPRIYAVVAEEEDRNASLAGVEVRRSSLSGVRRIVDVIFAFRHRQTDVTSKHFARVDVTEEFIFLVTPLSPYYEIQ